MVLTGRILQFIGGTVIVLGIGWGVLIMVATPSAYSYSASNSAGVIIIGSVISGLFLIGIGGAFVALADIAADTRRTANALDILVQHQTGVGTLPPTPPSKIIRPLRNPSNTERLLRRLRPDDDPPQ